MNALTNYRKGFKGNESKGSEKILNKKKSENDTIKKGKVIQNEVSYK